MLEEHSEAHWELIRRIKDHAARYVHSKKNKPATLESWHKLTECLEILRSIRIPEDDLSQIILLLRDRANHQKDEDAASEIHQAANELERRVESLTPKST